MRWLMEWLYPPSCAACPAPLMGYDDAALCPDCHDRMPWLTDGACDYCGALATGGATRKEQCQNCVGRGWRFTRAVGVARYYGPAKALVLALKFRQARQYAKPMGRLLALRIRDASVPECDLVVPVELCKARMRARGYNQSELLAESAARTLGWRMVKRCLRRRWTTPTQMGRTAVERRKFPSDVFVAEGIPVGAKVLLVDDVLTTGATASAAAGALLEAGAKAVYVAAFAR